jgi:cytochrome c2
VWSTEHGPQGGDELNLIARGRNYGWPLVTLGTECGGCGWQLEGRHDGYAEPLYSWLPSIGVSNLIEVRDFAPQWDGDLLVASLVNQSLHRLHLRDGRVQYDESIFMNERIRDIAQMEDGSILLWTDTGKLVLLAPAREPSPSARLTAALQAPTKAILADCAECHGLDEGDARAAKISLWGVFGRPIAAGDARLYSTVMKETAGEWDEATLDRFLADPAAMVPGTTMQYSGIADPETRRQVVEFLKELK